MGSSKGHQVALTIVKVPLAEEACLVLLAEEACLDLLVEEACLVLLETIVL